MSKLKRLISKLELLCCSSKGVIKYYRKRDMVIGEHCEINKNVNVITEPYLIVLGNYVRITSGVKLITHDGGLYVPRHMEDMKDICKNIDNADIFGKIVIGNNVHIGVDSIIMPGVTIGDNCIIGAGAVVTKDIPSNMVAVGVPAKPIKNIKQYVQDNMDSILYTKEMSFNEKKAYLLNNDLKNRKRSEANGKD